MKLMIRRRISLVLIAALLISLVHQLSLGMANAATAYTGARSVSVGGELFLGGNFIELGISQWGDFGTEGPKPETNFNGTNVRKNIGMSAVQEGFGKGTPMDYYLPGTPEERFAVGYQIGANKFTNTNSALMRDKNMATTVTDTSVIANNILGAKIVSTWAGTMEITQVISFHAEDKFFRNDVTITNLTDQDWDNARYMRSLDPDNTVDIGGSYATSNTVTHTAAEDGVALVKAEAISADPDADPYPIFFYSKDPAARGSIFGFTNKDPYAPDAYDTAKPKGYNIRADQAITMTWQSDKIEAGKSKNFTYYTSLDNRPLETILAEIEKGSGLKESNANDGTVEGTQRIVIKGGKLIGDETEINPEDLILNNVPSGLSVGSVKRISDTILEITLGGKASKHSSEYSVTNASLTIPEIYLDGIKGSFTSEPFPVTFIGDRAYAYISEANVSVSEIVEEGEGEGEEGEGEIEGEASGYIVITLVDGVLADESDFADVKVFNLPDGITYTVEPLDKKQLKLIFEGKTEELGYVNDAYVTIPGIDVIGADSDPLTTNTFPIDFDKKEPYLFVENPVLKKSDDTVVLTLKNGTFDDELTVAKSVYGRNLPDGVVIGSIHKDTSTQITVTLDRTEDTNTEDVTDAYFAVDSAIVDPASEETEVSSNTVIFLFPYAPMWIEFTPTSLYPDSDETFIGPLIAKIHNGKFDCSSSVLIAGITKNNWPEGVTIASVSCVDGSDDTELEITLNSTEGIDLDKYPAAVFASVTINPSIIVGGVMPLTSKPFAFKPTQDVTWKAIKLFNDASSEEPYIVRTDLKLITEVGGKAVTWTSTVPAVIATNGIVTRPEGADVEVILTATFEDETGPVTKTFTVIVKKQPQKLELVSVTVNDAKPDQAILQFNQAIDPKVDVDDFKGLTIDGRKVIAVVIDGDKAVVTLDEPFEPNSPLAVDYDPNVGGIYSEGETDNKLSIYSAENAEDQVRITHHTNNIVPLDIVTAFVKGGKLKIVFNKPIDKASLDLTGLEFGGVPVKEPFKVDGKELTVTIPDGATDDVLSFESGNIQHSGNRNNKLGKLDPEINLGSGQSYINPRGQLVDDSLGIVGRSGDIELTPAFDPNVPSGYKANVPNHISSVNLDPLPDGKPGTITKVTVNGKEFDPATDKLPLREGANTIKIGIYDKNNPDVLLGQYEITINRAQSPAGPANPDGGSTPAEPSTEKITIDVVIGGDNPADITKVEIERTRHSDGRITDHVTFTPEKALESAEKAKASGQHVARIVIPDTKDEVSEVTVDVPREAFATLLENKIDLEIYTDNAVIHVPYTSLAGLKEDFYFRLVPIKDADERAEVEQRARTERIVREMAQNDQIDVVARPMTIETNLSSRAVTLTLPLRGVELPQNPQEREQFLNELAIFIEHSDGDKEIVTGEVVKMANGELGLRFNVTKFSTFTILHMAGLNAKETETHLHTHYINGYTDGTFKPNQSTTRAELATMLVRLGAAGTTLSDSSFPDVPESHWAAQTVSQITATGLMKGYPNGTFMPNGKITRAEMAAIVFNYLSLKKGANTGKFADVAATHWANGIIAAVLETGIMGGYPDGTFQPEKELSRAEAVTILNRLFDRGPLYGTQTGWSDVAADHWAYKDIEEASRDHAYTVREQGGEQSVTQ